MSILLTPPLACCLLVRLAHAAHRRGWLRVGRLLALTNAVIHKADVDPASVIGPGLYIPHPPGIVFRGKAGRNLTLFVHAIVGPRAPAPAGPGALALCPTLGDDVTVGAQATILGPTTVGDRARIGPHLVVTDPVPAGASVVSISAMGRIAGK